MSSRRLLALAFTVGLTVGASAQSDQDSDQTASIVTADWASPSPLTRSVESLLTGRDDSEPLAPTRLIVVDANTLATGIDPSESMAFRATPPVSEPLLTGRESGDPATEVGDIEPPIAATSATTVALPADALTVVRPNPVRERAAIAFTVAERAAVTLTVVDIRGRVVAVAFEGVSTPGTEQVVWFDAASVAPGTYLAVLTVDGAVTSQTFQVVR